MVSSPAAHRRNLATPAAAEAERQRSLLAKLIAAIDPARCDSLAAALLNEFQSLGRIWTESPEALSRILGKGSPLISLIASAREASLETMAGDLRGIAIDPFAPALRRYLIASMGSLDREVLRVLFLDGSRRLIADEQVQQGTLGQLALYPRPIFRRALEHNAASLILVHNHPSGDPSPSAEDIRATRHLDEIGRSLDVEIIDHIVVTSAYAHHIINEQIMTGEPARPTSFILKSPEMGRMPSSETALANAKSSMRRRMLRRQLVGADELFGEPAWEMLIDVLIHELEGKSLAMSALCVTAGIPMSSALRLVQKLVDAGLLLRVPDPFDGRRSFMHLHPALAHRLEAYFEAGEG